MNNDKRTVIVYADSFALASPRRRSLDAERIVQNACGKLSLWRRFMRWVRR